MLQPTQPTATTPAPSQGVLEYATRCHNFWLFRCYHRLPAPAADLYHLLLFLWMQQGRPASIAAHQDELVQRLGIDSAKTLRKHQAPLLALGLLTEVAPGVKGKPGQYRLGPEPGQLIPKDSREILPRIAEAAPDAGQTLPSIPAAPTILGKISLESEPIVGNYSPEFLPSISDAGQNLPTIKMQATENKELANDGQILPSKRGEYVLDNTLVDTTVKNPTPQSPPPRRRRTPAEVQAERASHDAAAAESFALFLKAYEGANTENEKAWKYWLKLEPADWAAVLAYLPDYVKYTTGTRLRWRKGNGTFLFQKAWQQPDIITRLKSSFDAEQTQPKQPKPNAHTQRSVTEAARRNAPTYTPGKGGQL